MPHAAADASGAEVAAMKQVPWLVSVCGLFLAYGTPAAPGARPATAPSTQPTVRESLADGAVEFSRPADWEEAKKNRTPLRAAWVSTDGKGLIVVEVWPDGNISPGTGGQIVRQLRETRRKQAGVQIVMEPKLEQDKRFAIRIREQYHSGETTDDVLRLYRQVGPRVVMVMVNSKSPDDARDKEIHQAAEQVSLSVTFVRKPRR